jgi:toxin ParE1/3/4
MKRYRIRLSPEAENDLVEIHTYIEEQSGSTVTADRYVDRISGFIAAFDIFPERRTVRDEIGAGVRVIGFERSASVAFLVEDDEVVVLRVFTKGQELHLYEE